MNKRTLAIFILFSLALLAPGRASAATTGSVYVLLKNGGSGNFSSAHRVKVFANADYNAYDKIEWAPEYSWQVVRPGDTFEVRFSNLYVYSGWQGTYQFEVSFEDNDFTKKTVVVDNIEFPYASRTYYVSKLGVTSYKPSSAWAFDVASDGGNSAPVPVNIQGCYPDYPNPDSSLYVWWSLTPRPSDYSHMILQRRDPGSSYWRNVRTTYVWGNQHYSDSGLHPGTSYRYRIAHYDQYGAVTYGPDRECTTRQGSSDADGDGIRDDADNCPQIPNPDQLDTDGDGFGNVCDADDDGDGVNDAADNCVLLYNPDQQDLDGDGAGDACDPDDDDDGVADEVDNCPRDSNPTQDDLDGDGQGNACDSDIDGDGWANGADCAPYDATVNPGVPEIPYDGIDNNCNGMDDDTIEGVVDGIEDVLCSLPDDAWKVGGGCGAFRGKLNSIEHKIDAALRTGNAQQIDAALNQIEHDLVPKMDGCANSGAPDDGDWILDCASQSPAYDAVLELRDWLLLLQGMS